MNFDIKTVPFSRYGSFMGFSYLENIKGIEDGFYLRSLYGGDGNLGCFLKIDLLEEGDIVSSHITFNETKLVLENEKGIVEVCFPEENVIRMRGKNIGIRLYAKCNSYDYGIFIDDRHYEINKSSCEMKMMLSLLKGKMKLDAPWNIKRSEYICIDIEPEGDNFEIALEDYFVVWDEKEYSLSFDESLKNVEKEYEDWYSNTLCVDEKYVEGKKLASYITWSSMVRPMGKLNRPAMYMSKNFMNNIWSWDNCFNAMALIKNNPKLAWDQLMIFMENQDPTGYIGDFINDKFCLWNFCKPPIEGWTLEWMMERTDFIDEEKIEEIYEPLKKWTKWWFKYRDTDKNGIPEYFHGNDSGWDNSTVFDEGVPVESPDLLSYLIIQLEVISKFAGILGKKEEEKLYLDKRNKCLKNLIDHFWKENRFIAYLPRDKKILEADSLLLSIPIVLGKRLPKTIIDCIVQRIEEDFLTEYGLATESPNSSKFNEQGYWRGPIWAPSTMLMVDGLRKVGEDELVKKIANSYLNMGLKSGMAENYNPITGEGLCDSAFTWTSSVYLILGNEYC